MEQFTKKEEDILYYLYTHLPENILNTYISDNDKPLLIERAGKFLEDLSIPDCEIVDKLFSHWAGPIITKEEIETYKIDDPENKKLAIRDYLTDKETVIRYFLSCHSLLSCHVLEKAMDELVKGYKLVNSDWYQRYICPCSYVANIQQGCCPECGRSSKTWTLRAIRENYLEESTKFWFSEIVERIELGIEISEFEQ